MTRPALLLAALLAAGRAAAHEPAADMAAAATAWLGALTPEQRGKATFGFKHDERLNWHFIPRDRKGLAWGELTPAQQHLAHALLASGLGHRGLVKASTIMSLETVLREIEQGSGPVRDPVRYYFTVFGEPAPAGTWGWRLEGHHLSVNFTIVKGHVAGTPSFLGANPATVKAGPLQGLRALGPEEDLARALVKSLTPEQRRLAVIADKAPADIFTAAEKKVGPLEDRGVRAGDLTEPQRQQLRALIEEYVRRVRPELADADLKAIAAAGPENIRFAWMGGLEPGEGHYYRVQGATFLLEYDNVQNNNNHIHAVWRSFDGDFGEDLLRKHHAESVH
jgi:Spy/CpxP family protein refolding chaperone